MNRYSKYFGGTDAINWVSFASAGTLHTIATIGARAKVEDQVLLYLTLRFVSTLVMFSGLLIGRYSLSRFAKERPKPLITLASFILSIFASTWILDQLLFNFGFTSSTMFGYRISVNFLSIGTLLSVCALIVSRSRDLHRDKVRLEEAAANLSRIRLNTIEQINNTRQELVSAIQNEILSRVQLAKQGGLLDANEQLQSLIDDVVRPVSYQLSRPLFEKQNHLVGNLGNRIPWSLVISAGFKRSPHAPIASSIWIGVLSSSFLTQTFGLSGFVAAITGASIIWLSNTLFGKLWNSLGSERNTFILGLFFQLSFFPGSLLSATVIQLITGFDIFEINRLLSWIVITSLIPWAVFLLKSADRLQLSTNTKLKEILTELESENASLNSTLGNLQKDISRALHGPVQLAITRAILSLQAASEESVETRISNAAGIIEGSLVSLLTTSKRSVNLERAILDWIELWKGEIEIVVNADSGTFFKIQEQPATANALLELTREGINNAIRHGSAKRILIGISLDSTPNEVLLEIDNDGERLDQFETPGLGSSLFDELAHTWSRDRFHGLTRITARIPLQP